MNENENVVLNDDDIIIDIVGIGAITIDANKLEKISTPSAGKAFLMVDQETNKGLTIDYSKLADSVLSRLVTNEAADDTLKLIVVE